MLVQIIMLYVKSENQLGEVFTRALGHNPKLVTRPEDCYKPLGLTALINYKCWGFSVISQNIVI